MQPFWVRALVYGVAFGAFFGLYTSFSSPPRVLSTVTATLVAGVAFGLLMAYQGQSLYNDMTAAVAGLDATGRSQAIATVTDGGVPTDSAVRNSALRLGRTHLGLRSDAQLSRREWRTWLMLPVFGGLAVLMGLQAPPSARLNSPWLWDCFG
jgi:hypothetical protein